MIYQAVIFDFDGVIVDSEILSNALLAEALTEIGHPTSLEQALERYIGLSWRDTIAIIEDEIGRPLPGEFRPRMREAFECRLEEVTVVAGVETFLDALPPLPKAVASSSSSQWLRGSLERFGLAHHFHGRLFSAAEHVDRGKPHPDIYLHAARELGVDVEKALVLEDTAPGVKAAKAAGMTVVGLCAGLHCGPDYGSRLRFAGADHIAGSYDEVIESIA
jgi:HAD superfamily hydrolase (TIGR01509 family)